MRVSFNNDDLEEMKKALEDGYDVDATFTPFCPCCESPSNDLINQFINGGTVEAFKLLLEYTAFSNFEEVIIDICSEVTHYFDIKFVQAVLDETNARRKNTYFIYENLKKRQDGGFDYVSKYQCSREEGVAEMIKSLEDKGIINPNIPL